MKFTRTIFLMTMCVLVLLSTSNFVIAIHICGKKVRTVAFLSRVNNYQNRETNPICSCRTNKSEHCCRYEAIVHEANDSILSPTYVHHIPPTVIDVIYRAIVVSEIVPTHQTLFARHLIMILRSWRGTSP